MLLEERLDLFLVVCQAFRRDRDYVLRGDRERERKYPDTSTQNLAIPDSEGGLRQTIGRHVEATEGTAASYIINPSFTIDG